MKKKIWQRVAAVSMSALIAASSIPLSGSAAYAANKVKNLTLSDDGSDIVINGDGNYHITGTTTKHTVIVNDSVTATITLDGVNITSSTAAPMSIGKSAHIKMLLSGENTLQSTSATFAGLATLNSADLTIDSATEDKTNGKLITTGGGSSGYRGADSSGIGANYSSSSTAVDFGRITVNGGTIFATSGSGNSASSGIGGNNVTGTIVINDGYVTAKSLSGGGSGIGGKNVTVTINGGTVTANGSYHNGEWQTDGGGSGIGSSTSQITINGGTIKATGGYRNAGIGSNDCYSATPFGDILITGGNVTAISGSSNWSTCNSLSYPYGGAGIGGAAGNISIKGGNVVATSPYGAGIGSFASGIGQKVNINISGGTIHANCTDCSGSSNSQVFQYGAGIGLGVNATNPCTIHITGGTIFTNCIGQDNTPNSDKGSVQPLQRKSDLTRVTVDGNAVIFNDGSRYNTTGTINNGLVFFSGSGLVYGTPTIVQNTEFPANNTLTVNKDKTFKVAQGVKLTTAAMINIYGKIFNNGTIRNKGQIGTVSGGTIDNLANSDGTTGIVQYAAVLHRNDGSSDDLVKEDCWVTPGKPYSASLPELTRPNYVLVGWKDDSGNAMDADEIADGWNPVTLYAQWAQVGKINAKVTDSDNGQPVSGAVIAATNESGAEIGQATTGADGIALLTLKPGTYTATVKTPAHGYAASTAVSALSVEIGKTISANFTARPFKGSAAITHLDTKRNKLIAIAPISVTDRNGKVVYTGSSASTSLTVPNLRVPDAPFTIKETAALTDYRADTAAYTVNLTADGQTANVEMHSVPMMGDITYTATDQDGKPIVGATVNLVNKDGNVVATGTTDSNGKVTFKDVFTGDYTVQLPGYENGNVAVTVKDQQNTAPAPVKAAMLIGALEITHVDAQSNKALPVAKVQLKDKSGKVVFSGAPADSGTSLTIPNLTGPASPYTLTEETPITNYHANTTQYPISITTQGQAVKVIMKSSQYAGDVALHITDPSTGKPASGVTVNLIDKDGNIAATGKTDKDGNVTFTNIPIGTYTYAVDDPCFKLDGDKTKSVTVTDGSKQTASIPVISLGNVTLHITDPSTGKPASGVTVNLIDKDGKVVATGKTDKNGNVTFSGIPAGDYTYKVDDPRFVSITGKVTIGTGNTAGTIDIEVKHPASSPTVSTGSANITATDSSGKPLSNVPIIIKDSTTGKTVGTGTTDSNGNVTVPNLPDGTYTVSSGDSSVSLEGSITITNGQTSSVSLKGARRVPTGNAKLLVVDTHQQPLKNFTLLVMRADSPAANSSMIPLRKSGTIVNSVSSENNQVVAEVTTDANGYVILPQLDAGQYILIAKDSSEYKVDSSLAIVPSTTVSATVTATPISTSSSKQPAASASTVSGSGTKAPAASNNNQPTAETPVESSASVPSDYTVPKTGQSGIIPAIVLVLMAVCGTAGVLFSRKKRK